MATRVKWYGAQMTKLIRGRLADRLDQCGSIMHAGIVNDISTPVFPRSKPGMPPHLETGELLKSFTWENDRKNLITRVGSDLVNARYLEFGTGIYTQTFGGLGPTMGSKRNMKPRPHIRKNFYGNFRTFRVILFRPIF